MVHPVQQRVRHVRRRVRRLAVAYALSATLALVLATAVLAGLLDYLIRYEDPGLRLLGSGLLFAVLVWTFFRFLWPGWRYRPSDLQMAQWVEQRFPELDNRLSSSLAFVTQPEHDPRAGSVDLRRAVVARATRDLESIDLHECLDVRGPRKMAALAGLASLVVVGLLWLSPGSSLLAARRLAMPWDASPWPRRHQLEFLEPPARLAVGADFEVELIDRRGVLPETVTIFYWFDGDSEGRIQEKTMRFVNDRMIHRLENVQRSFHYRASGGDDDTMAWRLLSVVEPPRVEDLSLRLDPPAYTGWPATSSGENILALEGTLVSARGRLDKPAAAVTLHLESDDTIRALPAEVHADGRAFSIPPDAAAPWTLERSGRYWFEMTDPDGLQGGGDRRWTMRVVPDAPPSVALDKPGANTFVTAAAVVPIRAVVEDDLAIQRISVRFRRGDQPETAEQSFELYRGPAVAEPTSSGPDVTGDGGQTREVARDWDLSRLVGLAPGTWIEMLLVAEDYKPQQGQSSPRRLTIISSDELDERLAARQSYILGQLAEVLRMQQDTRFQIGSLESRWETTGQLDRAAIDQLQSAELNQRQIGHRLADPHDGVAAQITAVLDELASNRVDNPEALRRMNDLLSVLDGLNRQQLPEIQRQMIGALKLARAETPRESDGDPTASVDLYAALGAAGQQQDEVVATLEELLRGLSQWDDYRRFAREIGRIRRDQAGLLEQTDQLRLDILGLRPEDLSPQQQSGAKRLTDRQMDLARQLDKLLGQMAQMRGELDEAEPLAAEMLADALELAQRTAITGRMQESGRQIEANQVGQAVQTQQQVQRHLDDLLDALASRREQELDRGLRGLQQAADELEKLRGDLAGLLPELQAAQPDDETAARGEQQRLTRQTEELAESARRLARRLQRLQARGSGDLVQEASARLQQAAEADELDQTARQAQQADRDLQEAQQQLQAEQQQAQQTLAETVMARLQQEVAVLLNRQQGLLSMTGELEAARADEDDSLSPAQLSIVQDLATAQRNLAEETAALAVATDQSPVFALGMQGAAREMEHAGRGLESQQTGETTQRYQFNAIARLSQVHEALEQEPPRDEPSEAGVEEDDQADQPPGDALQRLAELKLLKLMQVEINRQTERLSDQLATAEDDDELLRRLDELAREQGQLADLMLQLSHQDPTQ